jgi:hypothetical protein
MILDDDCHIEGDALKVAVARAEEHDADLVSFRVLSGTTPGYSFNDEFQTGLLTFWGCAAMFSRRAIEAEPFYDPWIFIWANELDLTMRLLHRGFRHLHLPEVEAIHMKTPDLSYADRPTRMNARHFAYVAAKNLRARDAVGAVRNLTGHVALQAVSENRRALLALPEIARGVAAGVRARKPVRPEVSRVYRRHVWHYANPLPTVRSPLERLRPGDPEQARAARTQRWYDARREFYPEQTAALTL